MINGKIKIWESQDFQSTRGLCDIVDCGSSRPYLSYVLPPRPWMNHNQVKQLGITDNITYRVYISIHIHMYISFQLV